MVVISFLEYRTFGPVSLTLNNLVKCRKIQTSDYLLMAHTLLTKKWLMTTHPFMLNRLSKQLSYIRLPGIKINYLLLQWIITNIEIIVKIFLLGTRWGRRVTLFQK